MPDPKPTIDTDLVRRLVNAQFPQWRHLPVSPVTFGGWDNRTFHLGNDMTLRLPSAAPYALQVEKEHRWLPRLAPLLPLPIPGCVRQVLQNGAAMMLVMRLGAERASCARAGRP
ncbi:phosphotransferase, partial [Mesorhizobium sp. M0771]|uniref:phosphotransferase n=1 Tax=Mesorhizobium sp. M0771 TaxID=2956997 RepID=UPI0033392834